MLDGKIAQRHAIGWQPTNGLTQEHEANKATSLISGELLMVSHSRFGSCVQVPLSNIDDEEDQLDENSDDDSEDGVEMRHEDAKVFEADAAYGTYGGIANMYDAEALTPLEVDRPDPEPIPVKEETALVVEKKQRPRKRIRNVALAKVKTQAD